MFVYYCIILFVYSLVCFHSLVFTSKKSEHARSDKKTTFKFMNVVFLFINWCFRFFGAQDNGMETHEYKQTRMTQSVSLQNLLLNMYRPSASVVSVASAAHPINSISHPDAWAFLNRVCSGSGKEGVPQQAVADWQAKGTRRARLLKDFAQKVFVQGAPQSSNVLRLEAWVRIKQLTSEWRKSLVGFAYHTEEEMRTELKWSEFFDCNFRLPFLLVGPAASTFFVGLL